MTAVATADPYVPLCASADREEWLRARLAGIGGSEIAGVLEESPWSSPVSVYQDKVAPAEDEDQERLFWGRHLEEPIGRGYAIRTGRRFRPAGLLLRSVEHPWALATLDGWTCANSNGEEWPAEIKNVNEHMIDAWVDGAPRHVYLQVQHQMLVTGAPRVTVIGLLGGCQLVWQDVERDEQEIRRIIVRGERFWREHVEARVVPDTDHTTATRRALARLYPQDDGEVIDVGDEWFKFDEMRNDLALEKKAIGEQLDGIDNRLRAAIGTNTAIRLPDGTRYSWKMTRAGHRSLRRHKAPAK
jgi:putative phage-type endonuclease